MRLVYALRIWSAISILTDRCGQGRVAVVAASRPAFVLLGPPIVANSRLRLSALLDALLVAVVMREAEALKRPCPELGFVAAVGLGMIADGSLDTARQAHRAKRLSP
jgi:hypothetical protein